MQKKKDTIHQILINNKYDPAIIEDVKKGKKPHQKHPSIIEDVKNGKKNHHKQDTEETKKKGKIYIRGQGNKIHHKNLQKE
jgi:hypothetical protein